MHEINQIDIQMSIHGYCLLGNDNSNSDITSLHVIVRSIKVSPSSWAPSVHQSLFLAFLTNRNVNSLVYEAETMAQAVH